MANFTTIKNFLKKMEAKQGDANKYPFCGVILKADYEKLVFPAEENRGRRKVGFLVVPGKLTVEEWEEKFGVA